jgi:hypothetical protein
MQNSSDHALVTPDLVRRTGGGWLAIAPSGSLFSIAVTASTESEAREKFCSVYNRWIEIRESGERENACSVPYHRGEGVAEPAQTQSSVDFYLIPREIIDQFPEINVNNYDHDDACTLNSWGCEVVTNANPAPAQTRQHLPVTDGPPCPTCGFKITKRERSPFTIEDDAT